jgi:hypothetical protein
MAIHPEPVALWSVFQRSGDRFASRKRVKSKIWSPVPIPSERKRLRRDYLAYRDLISRQRAARNPVKASRCSSIGQALPR